MNPKGLLPLSILFLLLTGLVAGEEEILTNESVIAMQKAGIAPSVIINKIRSSRNDFSVKVSDILQLKEKNVAEEVINAMIEASRSGTGSEVQRAGGGYAASSHKPGIYYSEGGEEGGQLVQIEPSVYTQAKTSGLFEMAFTYGIAKAKVKAVLQGPNAELQIHHARPAFLFYFEKKVAGTEGYSSGTPVEFVLGKMKTNRKKGVRELVVGEMSYFSHKMGALEKYTVPFDYEEVAVGVYKVVPQIDLEPGEYGFYYAGTTPIPFYGAFAGSGAGKVFTFGISGTERPTKQ